MKKAALLFLMIYLFALSACKKSSSAPSIVGTWVLVNVSGTTVNNFASNDVDTATYSFVTATNTITIAENGYDARTNPPTSSRDTAKYGVISETWSFNVNGTYSINESYTYANVLTKTLDTTSNLNSGEWEYLSNMKSNNAFILNGGIPNLVSPGNANTYTLQSLNGNTMVITVTGDQSTNSGSVTSSNMTYTFTKEM